MTERFDPVQHDYSGSIYGHPRFFGIRIMMEKAKDGDYVKIEDYEKLLKKIELARVQYLGCGGNLKPQEIVDNIHKILDSE